MLGLLKVILVLLLCIPIAFLVWRAINTLMDNLRKQEEMPEQIRLRREDFLKRRAEEQARRNQQSRGSRNRRR